MRDLHISTLRKGTEHIEAAAGKEGANTLLRSSILDWPSADGQLHGPFVVLYPESGIRST